MGPYYPSPDINICTLPLLSSNYSFSFPFYLILLFQMSVHMRRLQDHGQPLQRVRNQLMIKMVERGNRRIKVKQKSQKIKCLTQIQSNKLVSIKLSFPISIQWGFAFCCKISALTQIVRDLNLLGNIKTIFRFSHYKLAVSTHPTGLHFCFSNISLQVA